MITRDSRPRKKKKRKRCLWRDDYRHAIYSQWRRSNRRHGPVIDRSSCSWRRGARGTFPNRFNFTIGSIVPWFKLCLTNARIYDRAGRTLIVIPVNIGNYLNGRAFRSPGKWKCFFQKFDRRNLTRWMADRTFMRRARFERYLVCSVEINCIIYIFFLFY